MPTKTRKTTVLFFAANPLDTAKLQLEKEVRLIQQAFERARNRDRFNLQSRWAVTIDDLARTLQEFEDGPMIIHFAGHGNGGAIYLQGDDDKAVTVAAAALRDYLGLFPTIQCVVLNACYSEDLAATLAEAVPCVVGMAVAVSDAFAIDFSMAFYDGIGKRSDFKRAFDLAVGRLQLKGGLDAVRPQFKQGKSVQRSIAQRPNSVAEHREREQQRRDQERHITEVRSDLQSENWTDGVVRLAEIFDLSRSDEWDRDLRQRIERMQKRYCRPERLDEYLRKAGTKFRLHENIGELFKQLESARCFGNRYDTSVAPFLKAYDIRNPGLLHLVYLFGLWETFLYDAWDIIAAFTLDTIYRVSSASEIVASELSIDGRKWLRMHPRMRGIMRLPALDNYKEWPTFGIPDGDGLKQSDPVFLKTYGLSNDPFAAIVDTVHPHNAPAHLHWVRISPDWLTRLRERSSIIVADSTDDSLAWAVNIPGQFVNNSFVIAGIAGAFRGELSNVESLLVDLCRIAAEHWLKLIAINSNALLAQSADNIDMLFDFFMWHCVDVEILMRRLGVYAVSPTMDSVERRRKVLVETYIRQCKAQRHRIADPTSVQYTEWLSIRPPGIDEETDVTVILALILPSMSVSQVYDVNFLAHQLRDKRVYFHLVGDRQTMEHFRSLRTTTLSWTNNEIQAMIDARIASASAPNGPQTFADLTDYLSLGNTNPYTYLWDAAQGSLHRALKYCRVVVEIHQNSGALSGFTEETLRSARDAVNRDKS